MAQQARGTLLQMARMMREPTTKSFQSLHKTTWDSPPSSDAEEEVQDQRDAISTDLHTLTSAVSVLTQSMKERSRDVKPLYEPRDYTRSHVIQSLPAAPVGMDSNLFKTVYEMGFNAGLARRDPEPPCSVCVGRREKNRLAAQEARKRQRLNQEGENDE